MEREDGPRAAGASGRGGHLGVAARAPLTLVATPTRARPAAAATAVADLFFRLANSGSGWSRGWTSGGRGERPRPMGSPRDRRAVAHSGWGSQACSLSVDGVQRQRHAAPSSFSRMAAGAGGDGARGWTSRRRGERPRRPPRGRCSSPLTLVATPTRARPAAAATAVADLFFRLANSGSGWSRGWTSGGRGERPRPMGSPRDRRAVAHSGWGSQACSLSVDGVQRQRHAAPSSFSRMAAGAGGDGARGWTSRRRGERPRRPPRGRCSSPVDPCRYAYAREARGGGDRGRRSLFRLANSGSGWSRGWTSGGRGERPRPMGSPRDRRAVAHSGWGSQACSLSVDGVQRQRHAAPSSFSRMAAGAGGDGARGWTSRRRGERPRRPPRGRCSSPVDPCRYAYAREARGGGDRGRRSLFSFGEFRIRLEPGMDLGRPGRAAATYGVAARSPGCCAQRLGVSGVLSIR